MLTAPILNKLSLLLFDHVALIQQDLILVPLEIFKLLQLDLKLVDYGLLFVQLSFTLLVIFELIGKFVMSQSFTVDHDAILLVALLLVFFKRLDLGPLLHDLLSGFIDVLIIQEKLPV